MNKQRLATLSTAIGLLVAAAGAVFVARAIADGYDTSRDAIADAGVGWLVVAFPVAFAGMTLVGVPWRRSMRLLGSDPSMRETLHWYFLGQLGKYVPGTLWPIVGRSEMARRGGVPRPAAYGSVVLTLGATYLAAMLVVIGFLPFAGENGAGDQWWVLLLLPVGLAVLHPAVLTWGKALVERIVRRPVDVVIPTWRDSVELVLRHAPAWFFIGSASWLVARAFDPNVGWAELMVPGVLSWIIGFVVVPAPGGIGVREAAFTATAVSLDPGIAATVAVVSRLIFMLVDASGALLATLVLRRSRG